MSNLSLMPRQLGFVQDSSRYPAAIGGIGSGKTYVGAAKVISRIGEPELGLICAPTYKMLRDATQRTLFKMLRDLDVKFYHNKSENLLTIPSTGHEILFRSLDDPDNLRGPNVNYAWVDEAPYVTPRAWRVVKGRVRVGSKQQAWITGTPKGRNWVWEEWIQNADVRHTLRRFLTSENPTLDPDYVEGLGYTGNFALQELRGEFVSFEGLVYSQFDRKMVRRRTDTQNWRCVIGGDIGTKNPTVSLVILYNDKGHIHVEAESYARDLGSGEIVDLFLEDADLYDPDEMAIDPSGSAYIKQMVMLGYPAYKGNNDIVTGIQHVNSVIDRRFTIDPSCVHTIAEFESYQYPSEETLNIRVDRDKPIKQNDHCMDALRYGIMRIHYLLGEGGTVDDINDSIEREYAGR